MFQLTQFDPAAAAVAQIQGAFSDVAILQFNQIRNDGDGNLEVVVGGQVLKKARQFMVVLGGFSGSTFQETRRQFWLGKWNKTQEGTPPDCFSADGQTPHPEATHKQHTDCKTCPRSGKNAEGYTDCSYTKDMLVYLLEVNAAGQAVLVLDTPLIWRASAMSVFGKLDTASNSAGLIAMAQVLLKSNVRVFEQVAFELAFHQTSKAPTLKIMGMLPVTEAEKVIMAASQPDTKALLEFKAPKPTGAAALPRPAAPAAAPAMALPALGAPAGMPAAVTPPLQTQQVAQPPAAAFPPAPAPAPLGGAFAGFGPASLVPPATAGEIAAAGAPVVVPTPAPAPARQPTAMELQQEIMGLMSTGQPVPPEKMALLQALMTAATTPVASAPAPAAVASAPVAQAATPSAQATALEAFSLSTPTR